MTALLFAFAGCTTAPSAPSLPGYNPQLLSGELLFDQTVPADFAPAHDILTPDESMRMFVGDIAQRRLAVVRFNQLLDKLKQSGFFDNTYDAEVTLSASETFQRKTGNCISYSNLFVALARLAGLEIHFQIAPPLHPTWNAQDGMLIRNNHINLSVRGQRFDRNRGAGYTIDFNLVAADPDAQVKRISDAHAASLFYANLAVNALLDGRTKLAFAYLKRGFKQEPENPDLWINLAAIYNRFGQHRAAVESLLVAQHLAPRDRTIVSALERTYRVLGEVDTADRLAVKVRRHRQANPYYHFAAAQQAIARGDLGQAQEAIAKAIRLRKQDPRFHHLQSRLHHLEGNSRLAELSLRRAHQRGWQG